MDELIEKILKFGDFWDYQHEEIFFKHDMHASATCYEQNEYEKQFQDLLFVILAMAAKIKRETENA